MTRDALVHDIAWRIRRIVFPSHVLADGETGEGRDAVCLKIAETAVAAFGDAMVAKAIGE